MVERSIVFVIFILIIINISQCMELPSATQPRLADRMCKKYSELPVSIRTDTYPLIVRGHKALPREFPHMVRLGYGSLDDIQWKCSGVIFSRRYILTAAHCTKAVLGEDPAFSRIGDLVLDDDSDDAQPETIEISQIIVHPNFTSKAYYNDIALLKLSRNIEFNHYARPACLNTKFIVPEKNALISGWNYQEWNGEENKELSRMILNLDSYKDCAPHYASNHKLPNGILNDQHICVGSKAGFNGHCISDAGSPLQVYHQSYHGMYNIIGISSFRKMCGFEGIPEVYTRISNYIDWIEEIAFSQG